MPDKAAPSAAFVAHVEMLLGACGAAPRATGWPGLAIPRHMGRHPRLSRQETFDIGAGAGRRVGPVGAGTRHQTYREARCRPIQKGEMCSRLRRRGDRQSPPTSTQTSATERFLIIPLAWQTTRTTTTRIRVVVEAVDEAVVEAVVEAVDELLVRRPGIRGYGASPHGPSCWRPPRDVSFLRCFTRQLTRRTHPGPSHGPRLRGPLGHPERQPSRAPFSRQSRTAASSTHSSRPP